MLEEVQRGLLVLAVISFLEGLWSVRGGWTFLRHCSKPKKPRPCPFPPATLIVPCRGLDPGLEENLSAYFSLDYPDVQMLLVTSDPSDPSVPVMEGWIGRRPQVACQILFAGAARGRSQKVHNLLFALERLRDQDRVVAFGDSDIRPHPDWLRNLVAPLQDPAVGISTGFRWYLPQKGEFPSLLRSAWNAGILTLLARPSSYFAWGGAMALRRETLDHCRVRERWQGALSDDFAVSHAVRKAGLRIHFEPPCLSFSYEDCSWRELLEWSYRQLAITRVYHPVLWWASFFFQGSYLLSLFAGGAWAGMVWALGEAGVRTWLLGTLVPLIYGLSCWKGWLRLKAVAALFPEHRRTLFGHRLAFTCGAPLTALVSLQAFFRSLYSRRIEWRGIRYEMVSPTQTRILE